MQSNPLSRRAAIPFMLTLLRLLLAPAMVALALLHPAPGAFALCLALALLSDVFDGIIARRLGVASATLRRFDSIADTIFCLAALFAVWQLQPAAIRMHRDALLVLAGLEAARYLYDWRKFGREASYHMWSSKLWGLALFAAFFELLVRGRDDLGAGLAIALGILADLEGLAVSVILPTWMADVPSAVHALRLRERWRAAALRGAR